MTLRLAETISDDARQITVVGDTSVLQPGDTLRIDSEYLEFQGFARTRRTPQADRYEATEVLVARGTASTHDADAEINRVSALRGTAAQQAALDAANAPAGDNPVATMADVGGGGGAVRWLGPCKIGAFDGQQYAIDVTSDPDPPFTALFATGGTYTLSVDGTPTAPIAFNADEAAIQAALDAIVDNVVVTLDGLAEEGQFVVVQFKDATATALLTADPSDLTGPGAPYTMTVAGLGAWAVEMFTPAEGDIVEDFLHRIVTPFAEGGQLQYTDDPTAAQSEGSPVWNVPSASQGVTNGLDLGVIEEYTNFGGVVDNTKGVQASALGAVVAAGIMNQAGAGHAGQGCYGVLPAVVLNAVPIYSTIWNVDPAPSQGEVWIWVKVATPAALMD